MFKSRWSEYILSGQKALAEKGHWISDFAILLNDAEPQPLN